MPPMKKKKWNALTFDEGALRFAQQSGFMGLEMTEEPLSAMVALPGASEPMLSEAVDSDEPAKKALKKAACKKRKAATAEDDEAAASEAFENEALAHKLQLPKKKQKKKRKEETESGGDDLFASLTAELEAAEAAKANADRQARQAQERLAVAEQKRAAAAATAKLEAAKRAGKVNGASSSASTMSVADGADAATAAGESWSSLGMHDALLRRLALAGFAQPTPIQRECLPAAVHGRRDVIGAAETGSGKTLAFGLPMLQRLLEERPELLPKSAAAPADAPAAASKATAKKAAKKAAAKQAPSGDESESDENTADAADDVRALRAAKAAHRLFALVVAPTRELAAQVADHLRAAAPETVDIVSLVGGMSIDKQRRQLAHCPEIVVGTPGRLWELIADASCHHLGQLRELRFFVLDEVDRMVEQGHFRELESILRLLDDAGDGGTSESGADAAGDAQGGAVALADDDDGGDAAGDGANGSDGLGRRQTFLFSATLMLPPKAREAYAKRLNAKRLNAMPTTSTMDKLLRMVRFTNRLKIVDLSRKGLVAERLQQSQLSCTVQEKDLFLFLLLRTRLAYGRTIVFVNAITALQRLKSLLILLEQNVIALQGGMQQRARLKALDRFKAGSEQTSTVLLATDVAARGLDIEGVDFVVHYQLPRSAEVYVHRSGRTARASASGLSIALVEPADHKAHHRLCSELKSPGGLPELKIDSVLIPRCREVISIARQLDKAAHLAQRKESSAQFRKKLAQEMDLPTDSDDDAGSDDDLVDRHRKFKVAQEKERLKAQLKRCLGRLERPQAGAAPHKVAWVQGVIASE